MSAAALALLVLAATGDPPEVRYLTKAQTRSWEPIAIAEVERMIEEAAREPLTAPGAMRLVKAKPAELRKGPYTLRILGRFVEEAERFSVYLSFGPGTQDDLPTLFATDTSEALGRKSRAEMEKRIRAAARRAGERLAEVIEPWLQQARMDVSPPPIAEPALPLSWGAIEVPEVRDRSKAIRTLLDARQPDHARGKALREVEGHVFDQQAARNAVERCVLADPSPDLRARCAAALAPKARAHVPTQRVLLHVLRTDVDERVLGAVVDIAKGFVGLSQQETIATWLSMIADAGTPTRATEEVVRLLAKEKTLPNLEYAVAACLQQDAVVFGKRYACAQHLLPRIPAARRRAVVETFLREQPVFGTGPRLAYEAVLKVLMSDRAHPPSPALGAMMLDLAERRATGRLRYKAIHLAGDHAPATAASVQRLLRLAHDTALASGAIRAAVEVTDRAPALRPLALAGLEELAATARWYPRPNRGDPRRDLARAKKRLRRRIENGK